MFSSNLFLSFSAQALTVLSFPLLDNATPLSFGVNRPLLPAPFDWKANYVGEFFIHSSCNATQNHELRRGLEDAVKISKHAKEHILVHGHDSPIYRKYFGVGPTGAVIGWFDKIATFNRRGVIFRCDDPDQNCKTQNQWAGHHRGKNASLETVICDLSFQTRLPVEALCARGYDVANGKPYNYWGLDLMHRLYHVDNIGEGAITHTSHGYQEAIDLAKGDNYTVAATNTDSLIFFASEAYAFDISVPGEGCAGKAPENVHKEHNHAAPAPAVSTPESTYTKVIPDPVEPKASKDDSVTASDSTDCHTHDDGTVHCV